MIVCFGNFKVVILNSPFYIIMFLGVNKFYKMQPHQRKSWYYAINLEFHCTTEESGKILKWLIDYTDTD